MQTEARAQRKAAEAAAAKAAAEAAAAAATASKSASVTSAIQKKSKRPGKQARDRAKAGLPVRPTGKPKMNEGSDAAMTSTSDTTATDKPKWPSRLKEKWFKCVDCSKDVSWPVDQQELFKSQGFDYIIPKRCPACMRAKKAKYGEGRDASGPTHCFNWYVEMRPRTFPVSQRTCVLSASC